MARGKDIRAGGAFVEIYLKGIEAAGRRIQQFGRQISMMGAGITAAGTAIAAPFIAASRSFAAAGDQLDKMSLRTGVGAEALSELGFAAEQSGAGLDQVGDALFRMRRRVANAATGMGPAKRALEGLGISAEELTKLSPEEQFNQITQSLRGVENESLAAQYAFEIFGNGAKSLLPLLQADIAALRDEAKQLAITLSDDDAAAAAQLTDATNRLFRVQDALWKQMGAAVAGPLTDFYNAAAAVLSNVTRWVRDNRQLVQSVFLTGVAIAGAGAAITALGTALVGAGILVSSVMAIWTGFVGALGLIFSPIGLAVAGFAALGYALVKFTDEGSAAAGMLRDLFGRLGGEIAQSVQAISDAITGGDITTALELVTTQGEILWGDFTGTLLGLWGDFSTGVVNTLDFLQTEVAGHIAEQLILWEGLFATLPDLARGALGSIYAEFSGLFSFVLEDLEKFLGALDQIHGIDTSSWQQLFRGARAVNDMSTPLLAGAAQEQLGRVQERLEKAQTDAAATRERMAEEAQQRADGRLQANTRAREAQEKHLAELRARLGQAHAKAEEAAANREQRDTAAEALSRGAFGTFSARELLGFSSGIRNSEAKRTAEATEQIARTTRQTRELLEQSLTLS